MKTGRWALVGALAGLTLLAAWPLLRLGYPTVGDGLNHLYRLVELDSLLRAGVWYPRWATDMAYGFGYPLFNYYSPLAYYAGALLHALGLTYPNALLSLYVLALTLAVTGAYALAAQRWGTAAGLAAAAAYGLAPYFYFNALARGALPETLGLGLLPWVLWAYAQLARGATPARWVLAAVLNTALVLTHLLSAMLAAPLIALLVLVARNSWQKAVVGGQWSVGSRQPLDGTQPTAVIAVAYQSVITNYFLALLLAGFFLFPAVLELDAVQVGQLTTPSDLDFHNNFLALTELLAWPRAYDARLVFNVVPPSLSLAAVALAAAAGGLMAGRRATREWLVVLALAVLLLLTLPVSVTLWERLPLLSMLQFPWRLVGPASLLLALLVGAGLGPALERWATQRWLGYLVLGAALAALWGYSLAWSYGPGSTAPATASLADLQHYERTTGQLGTTSAGEFLPAAVRTLPDPHALDAAYAAGRPLARLAGVPVGVTVIRQSADATRAEAEVVAEAPATLTFNYFDYPGWRATVDGQTVPITASNPHGLITVPVPAGQHHVAVRFGATPLRTGATLLSLLALAGLVTIARRLRRVSSVVMPHSGAGSHLPATLPYLHTFTLVFTLLLLIIRLTVLDPRPTPFARSRFDGASVAGAGQTLDVNFDDQLVLIGLDGPPASVAADETVALTLYWRAQNVPAVDYSTTVQVLDAQGELFGQSDSQHPGRTPTSRWRTDQYAQDVHQLRLLPGTPPGTYRLVAGVYRVGGAALAVLDASRLPQGQSFELGTLTVTPGRRPAVPDPAQPLEASLGPLSLMGYSPNTHSPQAGDELRLTLFWRAEAGPRPEVAVRLTLVGADGAVLAETTQPPAQPAHPSSAWATGEVVRAPMRLRVPAVADAGTANLTVSLVSSGGADVAGPVDLAALDVRVPDRRFDVPAMEQVLNAAMGAEVTLLGYDLAPTGRLTLYWQTGVLLDAGYKVFVHALDAGDQILAQTDTVPAEGTRPTTGWLPGEVVTDPHTLPLTGAARLAVGLYDESTGARLGRVVIELP